MKNLKIPFSEANVRELTTSFPTPFHVYDADGIAETARDFVRHFSWVKSPSGGFINYFAVKALPNPHILKLLAGEGYGFDCSSLAELELCARIGLRGERLFFSSNNTQAEEYEKARELGAIINLDDISHIEYLEKNGGLPSTLCFRFNPGPLRDGNALIGKPEEAKYGLTRDQIFSAYELARSKGVGRFGLHTMLASNERNPDYFVETARMMFELALELHSKKGIKIEFLNLGGGMGIPYRPQDDKLDLEYVSTGIRKLYETMIQPSALHPLRLCTENGRIITGPHGYLLTTVIHFKDTYRNYAGVDACMANLMRPGMYGAYHHITVVGKNNTEGERVYDVTGSLCENNDKFAIARTLPELEIGDILVIHDTGAHGHAMGFNYNGKLRSAEILWSKASGAKLIRRAETLDDLFRTIDFDTIGS